MKVYVLSNRVYNGQEIKEGYIEYIQNGVTYESYFKLQYDNSVNDYDYSDSDITEYQEEELHELLLSGQYEMTRDEKHIRKYLDSAIAITGQYIINKEKEVGLSDFTVKAWKNTKGYIHMIRRMYESFNIGKKLLCDVEFAFSKKGQLKEVGYNVVND